MNVKMTAQSMLTHLSQNIALILLSLTFLPLSALTTALAYIATTAKDGHQVSNDHRGGPRRTILVTGVSMTKGLCIARLLSEHTEHRIIGADVEDIKYTSPGRYSRAIAKFFRLKSPENGIVGTEGSAAYVQSLLDVIRKEHVSLWISCSGVTTALEDGQVVERATAMFGWDGFRAIQFDSSTVRTLHEKEKFVEEMKCIGMSVPESHFCEKPEDIFKVLEKRRVGKRFILKPVGVDDIARGMMMTLLPLNRRQPKPDPDDGPWYATEFDGAYWSQHDPEHEYGYGAATEAYIRSLHISEHHPFLLQKYIKGREYCTHSLIIRGEVKAFVACPSSDMLMHYNPLPATSWRSLEMLRFTKRVAEQRGEAFTGHLSFDFLVQVKGKSRKVYAIECNPRAHTAVVLFRDLAEYARAYLGAFDDCPPKRKGSYADGETNGDDDHALDGRGAGDTAAHELSGVVTPWDSNTAKAYWVGHDIVALVLLPLLKLPFSRPKTKIPFREIHREGLQIWNKWIKNNWDVFVDHVGNWNEGSWVPWDPVPFFVLYHVYWPVRLLGALLMERKWERVNVSTGKMFRV